MRSTQALLDEVSAAFQFPSYFGENWDALDECMSEIDWLPIEGGILLVVKDAGDVLVAERPDTLAVFVEVLQRSAREYANPIELGESWDRPALPFHVVLHSDPREFTDAIKRWKESGASVDAT